MSSCLRPISCLRLHPSSCHFALSKKWHFKAAPHKGKPHGIKEGKPRGASTSGRAAKKIEGKSKVMQLCFRLPFISFMPPPTLLNKCSLSVVSDLVSSCLRPMSCLRLRPISCHFASHHPHKIVSFVSSKKWRFEAQTHKGKPRGTREGQKQNGRKD